ncbi:hypothetical protein ACW5WN_01385 [Aeromonas lacus]
MEVTAQEKMEEIEKHLGTVVDGIYNARVIDRNAQNELDTEIAIKYWNCFCVTYERCMMELSRLIPEDSMYWVCQQNTKVSPIIDGYVKFMQEFKESCKHSKLYPHLLNHKTTASKITDFDFWNVWLTNLDYTYNEATRDALDAIALTVGKLEQVINEEAI